MNDPIKTKSIYDQMDGLNVATDLQVISIQLPKNLIRELELAAEYQQLNLEAIIYLALDAYAEGATLNLEITPKDVNAKI
jgi:hypothetical protein